ncbi:hypothetical protein [uncultured Acetatifactor sp.]|uniref:hypothetical protein n=1 Tax=uncultured Acetatifactor sp. TaxID=1671927 RepID=UPI00260E392C|nr:hypothetical protein [uncultured Acetatifactor sp.]
MNGKDVNRYLTLLDRKLFIVAHSGVEWKPEYGPEMEAIDQELVELRKLVDQEHGRGRRMEKEVQMKAFASESDFDEAYEKFLADLPQAGIAVRSRHERMERNFTAYLDAFEKWVFRHAYEAGYAAAMAAGSGVPCTDRGTVMEQMRREALYAQRSYAEDLLHDVYGQAKMARRLGAITKEEFLELNYMTVCFMNTDQEYIRRRNEAFFNGSKETVKGYRVKYWNGDGDGGEDYMEFDREDQAMGFYNSLDGKAEVQRYIGERHEYEAFVYPTFEV